MYFLGIGEAIKNGFRTLMMTLCDVVYRMIIFFFDIFERLGTAEILQNETIQSIYQHVGLILGLFMVFRITFSAIEYLINPDAMMDKKKGFINIVKKIVIVVVLLGVTPYIFDFAFDVQRLIMDQNIIPRVITNTSISVDGDFGEELAWTTFSSFYNINVLANPGKQEVSDCIDTFNIFEKDVKANGNFRFSFNCLNEKTKYNDFVDTGYKEIEGYIISFDGDGILALIVGCIILWMIIMYTIQVGIRVIQLGYLQLIAPVPIMLYITPKGEDRLNKWIKQCTSTYLDFFLRTAIIYFVVYIINILISNDNNYFLESVGNPEGSTATYITIVMIIALLIFAKKVPDLFKELFPSSSGASKLSFGLNPKKELNNTLAAGLIGGAVGALGAGASNTIHGFRNMSKAWKGSQVNMKKWKDLSDEERKGKNEFEYNKMRREQMWNRVTSVGGAGLKGVASVAGGVLGGARAGLKTKDITKAGEAVKTANANREKHEQRREAGLHWYNTLGDKVLEFSGETEAIEMAKNRQKALLDEKTKQNKFARGAKIASRATNSEGKLDPNIAFNNQEFRNSYNEVARIKKDLGTAELQLNKAQANLNAAYNYDASEIEIKPGENREEKIAAAKKAVIAKATEIYEQAKKNNKAMEGQLELAKAKHDTNRKIYTKDAEIEDDFKYWDDINKIKKGYKEIPELSVDEKKSTSQSSSFSGSNQNLEEEVRRANNEYIQSIGKNEDQKIAEAKHQRYLELERQLDEQNDRKSQNQIQPTNADGPQSKSGKAPKQNLADAEKKLKKMRQNEAKYGAQAVFEQERLVNELRKKNNGE